MNETHKKFRQLGRERNRITYKLLALLPEIYEKEIYKLHDCATIYEYAGKFAGLPKSVVFKTLSTAKHLKGKPALQKTVESQGIHKVAIVASLADAQTDEMFADKVENMSKEALVQFSRECRGKAAAKTIKIELDEEMTFLFLKLKKEVGKDLTYQEAMRRLLKMMAKNKKTQVKAKRQPKNPGKNEAKPRSRYIPVHIKTEKIKDGRCSHPGCNKPYDVLHHTHRFATGGVHETVIPLCKEHHEFAHNGITESLSKIDIMYRKHRQEALL